MPAVAPKTHPLLDTLFPQAVELDCPVTVAEGRIPAELRGTVYQNRPGSFRAVNLPYRNWLDGDGFLSALWISGGSAWLKSRFVKTRKRAEEAQAGLPVYRTFGTRFAGDKLENAVALASPANIHVQPHGGKLYAFGEQGAPWEVDPRTLETLNEATFGGLLHASSPFSGHGKIDGGELINFGIEYHPTKPRLHGYCFGEKNRTGSFALDGPRSAHDFAVTKNLLVLHLPPYFLDTQAFASGKSVLESLTWRPERGLRLVVVDRQTFQPARRFEAESRYSMHTVRAVETKEGVELDVLEGPEPLYAEFEIANFFQKPRRTELVRYVLPKDGEVRRHVIWDNDRMLDFPLVDNQTGAYFGLASSMARFAGDKFFDEVWRWRDGASETFRLPAGSYFCGDPVLTGNHFTVFVATPTLSEIWIFAKSGLARGAVARLRLPARLPVPLHGSFVPA